MISKNTVFYAEENKTNIGDGKYALVQKVKVGDLTTKMLLSVK